MLVDAHHSLRAINEIFGIEDRVGLSDAVAGAVKVTAALHVTGLEGLEILPVGSAEENWSELLNRAEFFEVLTDLTERFDRVIIDGGCIGRTNAGSSVRTAMRLLCWRMRGNATGTICMRRRRGFGRWGRILRESC